MGRKFKQLLSENKGFLLFVILMTVFRSSFADWNRVPTGSMQPTIVEGDHIVVNKLAYDLNLPFSQISLLRLGQPQRGEIVIFNSKISKQRLVKRIVGIPGDTVEMRDNVLFVNDQRLDYLLSSEASSSTDYQEDLLGVKHLIRITRPLNSDSSRSSYDTITTNRAANFGTVTVPQNNYLVLGDNRDNSADSRFIGFVPRNEIIGRSRNVAFSLNAENYYLPRSERFIKSLF